MFAYASLVGLAKQNYLIPCLLEDNYLSEIFRMSMSACPEQALASVEWARFTEHRSAAYDYRTSRLNVGVNIELMGYFQSWKYFDLVTGQLRGEFVFDQQIVYIFQGVLEECRTPPLPTASRLE